MKYDFKNMTLIPRLESGTRLNNVQEEMTLLFATKGGGERWRRSTRVLVK